ncbi:MAG: dihydroorotate dehydrogenase electron transfer subunit, partial [Coriobacteriales bacterium]|nr:dihydroorotate dehydrogenase electron transfer subunit [Coriobacteriales bacterium]
ADLIAQGKVSQIYCCGPTPMLAAVATQAKQAKIACQVSLEAKMACGVGACLGCVVETRQGYRRVCADGPIFDAQDILW